jgi:hypothetical protein
MGVRQECRNSWSVLCVVFVKKSRKKQLPIQDVAMKDLIYLALNESPVRISPAVVTAKIHSAREDTKTTTAQPGRTS